MDNKMIICYIGDGRSIHTQRWVNHFSGLGHDVHLISNWKTESVNATVHLIDGTGIMNYMKRVFRARKLIREIKPDIVHAHFVTDSGFIGAMSGFHPLVISPWGSDIVRQPEESAVFRTMVKYALRKADIIQCGDEDMEKRIHALVGDTGKIRRIGWGVDTELFRPRKSEKGSDIRILYLRISHDNYRTSTLLEAMPDILKKHGNVKFLILKKGEHLDRTLEAVSKMSAGDRVELIDPVPHGRMPELLTSCDIYLDTVHNPLPGCGIGITAMEAMSCGLPVIMADTNGHNNYIEHRVSGYIYKGQDPKSLAKALDEVIADAELRRKMGENAREYILEKQSWPLNMKRMEAVYRELIRGGDAK